MISIVFVLRLTLTILIIFAFYVLRALSISMGDTGTIPAVLAAWIPDLTLAVLGGFLYYRKVYTIS